MAETTVTPELFEAFVTAFADTLIQTYRQRWTPTARNVVVTQAPPAATSPWLRVKEAARHAQCSRRVLYAAVHQGRLRAVHVGGRRSLRFRAEWIDAWLEAAATT